MTDAIHTIEKTPAQKPTFPMKLAIITGIIALAILGLLGWGLINTNSSRPKTGMAAPDFPLQFFNGYEWENRTDASLADMQGKVVVLNFWASWCVECKLEADILENTWREYADDGVVFLGIAYLDAEPKALDYMAEYDITYPNAPDLRSTISEEYEITGVPETFFIDKKGVVRHVVIGPVTEGQMINMIEELVAE